MITTLAGFFGHDRQQRRRARQQRCRAIVTDKFVFWWYVPHQRFPQLAEFFERGDDHLCGRRYCRGPPQRFLQQTFVAAKPAVLHGRVTALLQLSETQSTR
jgi:hypothetical protein